MAGHGNYSPGRATDTLSGGKGSKPESTEIPVRPPHAEKSVDEQPFHFAQGMSPTQGLKYTSLHVDIFERLSNHLEAHGVSGCSQ